MDRQNGHDLIYGGSKCGLMGSIAESVLQNGGKVTGVEPQFFVDSELQHDGLTELIVTKDMTDRKTKMIEARRRVYRVPGWHGHAGGNCGSDVEGIAEAFRRAVHSL